MRLLFFILLLVNVLVYAFFSMQDQSQQREKSALPALRSEKIRLTSEVASTTAPTANPALSCWNWQGLKKESLKEARDALAESPLAEQWKQATIEEFWVMIPPLRNQAEADKKLVELKSLGIQDGSVAREPGKWRFAISFEGFTVEDEAVVRLNQLKEKGVRSAKIQKREAPGNVFMLQKIDEKALTELKKLQSKFADSELKQTECKVTS